MSFKSVTIVSDTLHTWLVFLILINALVENGKLPDSECTNIPKEIIEVKK